MNEESSDSYEKMSSVNIFSWKLMKLFYSAWKVFFWSVFSPNIGKYGPEKTPYLGRNMHKICDKIVCNMIEIRKLETFPLVSQWLLCLENSST